MTHSKIMEAENITDISEYLPKKPKVASMGLEFTVTSEQFFGLMMDIFEERPLNLEGIGIDLDAAERKFNEPVEGLHPKWNHTGNTNNIVNIEDFKERIPTPLFPHKEQ